MGLIYTDSGIVFPGDLCPDAPLVIGGLPRCLRCLRPLIGREEWDGNPECWVCIEAQWRLSDEWQWEEKFDEQWGVEAMNNFFVRRYYKLPAEGAD